MSYQKKVWVTKEVIYGKDLNHIEDGIYNIDQQLSQQSETINKAYLSTDSSSSDLADNDYIPFYDSSAGSRKKVQYSVLKTSIGGDYAPKNHATSATTYGKGSTSNFGHLKISDSYTSSAGNASDGVAASSKAVYDAYNTLNTNKYDKSATYSKTEVDNLLSSIETNIQWKESVATYADIATTYPNPQDGWTVNVNDTDYTYRYDGVAWIAISANAIPDATISVKGLMTTTMVSKLNGIAEGAEVNQNAFSNFVVGSTTIAADGKTDTLTLVAGTNVTLTPDATNDKITITTTNTTYSAGVGLALSSTTLKARLKSETQSTLTAAARGSTADREYAVGVDAQGNLSVNVPWTNDNTTYSAGTGLTFSGTTINHSNSVTAGTAKGDDSKTLTFGGTFTIPTVAYDSQGHITAKGTTTMTMPANPNVNTTYSFASGTTKGAFSVTPSGGSAQSVSIYGLGSAAYTASTAYAASSHTHSYAASPSAGGNATALNGTYSGNGGAQPPSFVAGGQVKAAMMNNPKGLTLFPTYCDVLMMDCYTGTDVPWTTGLGIAKQDANPRMFIFNGAKGNTTTWKNSAEVITSKNIGSQSVNYATSAGSCSGSATNVTGTVAIANGGTGATTRLNAAKNLTNENVGTSATYFVTLTDSWGKFGYSSTANVKSVLGLKSAAYTESSAYATSGHTHATTIATSSGTNQLTMAANTKYAITAGGTSYVFTTPPDNNTRDFRKGTSRSGATADVLYFVYTT